MGVELELVVVIPLVVVDVVVVAVEPPLEVGAGLLDFGRYLMPVEGQLDVDPEGATGTKVPDLDEVRKSEVISISWHIQDNNSKRDNKCPAICSGL